MALGTDSCLAVIETETEGRRDLLADTGSCPDAALESSWDVPDMESTCTAVLDACAAVVDIESVLDVGSSGP